MRPAFLLCPLLLACGGAPPTSAPTHQADRIEWLHDDYPGALTAARAAGKPLLVDMWAPWCHTCLSMKHHVLADPGLAPLHDRFVWLALDTDRPQNAAAVAKLPMRFWPTFFVLDPTDESVQGRFQGGGSLSQFRAFLQDAERAWLDARSPSLPEDDPLRAVRAGHQAVAAGDLDAADAAYAAALAAAPVDWPRTPDVLVALIGVRHQRQDWAGCAALALDRAGDAAAGRNASAADFAYFAQACAAKLEPARRDAVLRRVAAVVDGVLAGSDAPLSVDDRSEAMRIRREIHLALGEDDAARALARRQQVLLDEAAAAAPEPIYAMTHGWPRAEVYAFLGEPAALVPDLRALTEALPNQYDPPYRLAWVLLRADRADEARASAELALARVYGPRAYRVWKLLADIEAARADRAGERRAWAGAVEVLSGLPDGQRRPEALAEARAKLAALSE